MEVQTDKKVENTSSFCYTIQSSRSAEEVFEFLLKVENWWMGIYKEEIIWSSNGQQKEFVFLAGDGLHYSKQKLLEIHDNRKIVWQVIESKLSFLETENEWDNTKLKFQLEPIERGTLVTFTHEGLHEGIECFQDCAKAWNLYLKQLQEKIT